MTEIIVRGEQSQENEKGRSSKAGLDAAQARGFKGVADYSFPKGEMEC